MRNGTCSAFLFDGAMDHQIARVMAGLNRGGDFVLETFSTRKQAVTTVTGLRVMPHTHLAALDPEDIEILLLPGGDRWEKGDNLEIFPFIMAVARRRPVIAVGSAVLGLADIGLLDNIPHTGESPAYIKRYCPEYGGAAFFIDEPCVCAGSIITVSDEGPVELSHGMFGTLAKLHEILHHEHGLLDPAGQRK
jgi:transcriptional regulator GlxA family with amidase domain